MCQEPALSFAPSHGELGWDGQVTLFPFGHQLPLQGQYLHPYPWGDAVPQDKGLDGSRSCPKAVRGSGACWGVGEGKKVGLTGSTWKEVGLSL